MDIATLILAAACLGLLLHINTKLSVHRTVRQRIIMDTSTLMDGRVVELARSGFLRGEVIVSQRVLAEMQGMADNGSSHKRERARLGLDVLHELQTNPSISIKLVPGSESLPVDDELRALAKRYRALLMTNDFNLAKVAQVEAIGILNINELAQSLRPVRLPGERVEIKIIQKGAERHQGVGYLEDGTMVVVENAAQKVGNTMPVVISRTLQTTAGKMCFAEITTAKGPKSALGKIRV